MSTDQTLVLVVDDDPDIREILQLLLETAGFMVQTAGDGAEALAHLEGHRPPALVLLDLMMPRMDGEEFLRVLRDQLQLKTPVLVMSGHAVAENSRARSAANACLAKPIDLDDLMSQVHRLVHPASEPVFRQPWETTESPAPPGPN